MSNTNLLSLTNLPQVKLHDSLAGAIKLSPAFGRMLHHPLLIEIFYDSTMNHVYNLRFLQKRAMVERALNEKKYGRYVFLHERPYRMITLVQLITSLRVQGKNKAAKRVLQDLLVNVYVDAEGTNMNRDLWQDLFSEYDHDTLKELPDGEFIIFRGYNNENPDRGFSWTLSRKVANFFACRFQNNGSVKSRTVTRADCTFFTNDRGESEVLYFGP